jgi:hypothetical protein
MHSSLASTAPHHLANVSCTPSTFSFSSVLGAELVNQCSSRRSAQLHHIIHAPRPKNAVDFCNVTITYGHTGWNESINVALWFPLAEEDWNGRLLGVGGGSYAASFGPVYETAALRKGYVAVATDSGQASGRAAATDPSPWVTLSPGNFNYPLIEDFASRTLGELSVIAKRATKDYFGARPAYSYFTGCSNGGRQGLELAQSFPDAFDGILAGAPAVYFETILVAGYRPTLLMNQLGVFPPSCEIRAFTAAAVERCDGSDGLEDGIISHPADCDFDVRHVIGRNFTCDDDDDDDDGEQRPFTQAGASIVEAAWQGLNASGVSWPGVEMGADLTAPLVVTACGASQPRVRGRVRQHGRQLRRGGPQLRPTQPIDRRISPSPGACDRTVALEPGRREPTPATFPAGRRQADHVARYRRHDDPNQGFQEILQRGSATQQQRLGFLPPLRGAWGGTLRGRLGTDAERCAGAARELGGGWHCSGHTGGFVGGDGAAEAVVSVPFAPGVCGR